MLGNPQPSSSDVRFVLFGIPISISPIFWFMAAILGFLWTETKDGLDMPAFLAVILAVLLSVLVHELGHALVIRYIFGALPVVVLHGLGGVTMHDRPYYYRTPRCWGRIFISFAGPLAGFLLSAVSLFSLFYFDSLIERGSYLAFFLACVASIGIFWGILNLMPVYPLDGGQIFREICEMISPRKGTQVSLVVSAVVAILIAMLALLLGQLFLVLLFGVLAYQSIQTLQSRRF